MHAVYTGRWECKEQSWWSFWRNLENMWSIIQITCCHRNFIEKTNSMLVFFCFTLFLFHNILYEGSKKLGQFHGSRCLAFLHFKTILIIFWQQHAIYKLHVHDTRILWDMVKVSIFQLFLLYVKTFLNYVDVFEKWVFFLQIKRWVRADLERDQDG